MEKWSDGDFHGSWITMIYIVAAQMKKITLLDISPRLYVMEPKTLTEMNEEA